MRPRRDLSWRRPDWPAPRPARQRGTKPAKDGGCSLEGSPELADFSSSMIQLGMRRYGKADMLPPGRPRLSLTGRIHMHSLDLAKLPYVGASLPLARSGLAPSDSGNVRPDIRGTHYRGRHLPIVEIRTARQLSDKGMSLFRRVQRSVPHKARTAPSIFPCSTSL